MSTSVERFTKIFAAPVQPVTPSLIAMAELPSTEASSEVPKPQPSPPSLTARLTAILSRPPTPRIR